MHILALADQGVVSAASFLTTVIIGRFTQPSELGLYSIGLALIASCLCIQEALISTPYAVQRHHCRGTPAELAGASLAQTAALSSVTAVVLAVVSCGLAATSAKPDWVGLSWALVAVTPFLMLREFARRYAFAHLRVGEALILDTAGAVIQLAALVWLGWTGQMSALTACAALGVSGGLTGLAWLYIAHADFMVRADQVLVATRRSWTLGKWLFANQLVLAIQASLVYWLLAWLGGITATGIYGACMSIALFSNPLILGASNLLVPKLAVASAEGGGKRLRRETIQASLGLILVMTLFCVSVAVFADAAMRLLYPSQHYAGQADTVIILALGMLVIAVGMPANSALTSVQRPRVIFWTGLLAAVITAVLIWLLMPHWGLAGAAYGVLGGNLARTAARWVALLLLLSRNGPHADPAPIGEDLTSLEVVAVLQHLTPGRRDRAWTIERIDQGLEADIYAALPRDYLRPDLETSSSLAIKLYKPAAAPGIELVRSQFAALSQLHAALNGSEVNTWKILSPAPICACERPLALVMSMVPGKTLSFWLERGGLTHDVLCSLPHVIIAAANRLWSLGQVHGDLTFDNILCDIGARDLSFVDPGVRTICPFRDKVTDGWKPPAHDLAHMLYDVAVSVLSTLVNPVAIRRKRIFAESVVRAFIATISSADEKRSQLGEIQACVWSHLMALADGPHSLRKVYHKLQQRVGRRRVLKTIRRVAVEEGLLPIQSPGLDFSRESYAISDAEQKLRRRCKV